MQGNLPALLLLLGLGRRSLLQCLISGNFLPGLVHVMDVETASAVFLFLSQKLSRPGKVAPLSQVWRVGREHLLRLDRARQDLLLVRESDDGFQRLAIAC
jgi:hypothetical protein